MGAAGVNREWQAKSGGALHCALDAPGAPAFAAAHGITRKAAAIQVCAPLLDYWDLVANGSLASLERVFGLPSSALFDFSALRQNA